MTTNYPIGDFLIRLKNAALSEKREFRLPKTNLIKETAQTLKRLGYLNEVSEEGTDLLLKLSYRKKEPMISEIKLISKPGVRVYIKAKELESYKGAFVFLVSTPQGILSSKEAVKKHLGGEVIAEIF